MTKQAEGRDLTVAEKVEAVLDLEKLEELLEGGASRFWCKDRDISAFFTIIADGRGEHVFHPPDEDGEPDPSLTGRFSIKRFRDAIVMLALEQWLEDYDAETADAAIQLACFGEVVYG